MRDVRAAPVEADQRLPSAVPTFGGPVALLVSPHAGRLAYGAVGAEHTRHVRSVEVESGAAIETAQRALDEAGVATASSALTTELGQPGFVVRQIALWRDRGCVAVVAAGGDGTVGAAATLAKQAGLPLGILPLGTSNDVARSLGIPMDVAQAARIIASGETIQSDLGQVIPAGALAFDEGRDAGAVGAPDAQTDAGRRVFWSRLRQQLVRFERRERHALHDWLAHSAQRDNLAKTRDEPVSEQAYFLHALTLGLNVEFARLATDAERRRQWGALTYAASAMEALQRARPIRLLLRLQGYQGYGVGKQWASPGRGKTHMIDCHALQLAVINQPVFGGALQLNLPNATGSDGLLDFVLIEAPEPGSLRVSLDHLRTTLSRWVDGLIAGDHSDEAHETMPSAPLTELADAHGEVVAPGISRFRARAVVIETPDEQAPLDVTLDGELGARTPVFVRVAPAALRVFASHTQGIWQARR